MTTLTQLQENMTEFLTGQGVRALTAWPGEDRLARTAPLAVVRVKEVAATPAGFQGYLGQVYDGTSRTWTERYGQRAAVQFALDLYSPVGDGEEGCRRLLDQVAGALQQGGPAGVALEKWTMGETAFHRESGMFRGRLLAVCRTLLVAESSPAEEFLGFTVKGGITHDVGDNP